MTSCSSVDAAATRAEQCGCQRLSHQVQTWAVLLLGGAAPQADAWGKMHVQGWCQSQCLHHIVVGSQPGQLSKSAVPGARALPTMPPASTVMLRTLTVLLN